MDQINPAPQQGRANQIQGYFGQHPNISAMNPVRTSPHFATYVVPQVMTFPEQNQKRKEFSRGVYVTGFEKTLTPEMLEEHFKIKPIHGLKLPMSKYNENKGFAFIYYGSEDDASFVKKKLDHSIILKSKIRVTRTVISENLSKMMFKLKTNGLSEQEVTDIEKRYFNEETLEKQVQKIIEPIFSNYIEVNKIVVPVSKKEKKPLKYARVFFYVSNLKEAFNTVKNYSPESMEVKPDKNHYETVLAYICNILNQNDVFRRNVSAEIYEYTKKNQSNVLHLKGIEHKPKEDPLQLASEIKQLIQGTNQQANILTSFASITEKLGAWANVTFSTYEETVQSYEYLKNNRILFRGKPVYASLRNVKDTRTVVISTVKKDIKEREMESFLKKLADSSPKIETPENEPSKGRKYDFFSFNILEQKTFYLDNNSEQVGFTEDEIPQNSWREMNTVPRRVVVHFLNEINEEQTKELVNDLKNMPEWERIFFHQERKQPLRANHQKGHIKHNKYVKHTDLRNRKKGRLPAKEKIMKPREGGLNKKPATGGNYHKYNVLGSKNTDAPKTSGGVPFDKMKYQMKPRIPGNLQNPAMGQPSMGQPPMGQPSMGQPSMGQPVMGQATMGQATMGQTMGQPMMGQNPQMGSLPKSPFSVPPPHMGQMPPPMGQMPPTMGQMPPTMGQMPPPKNYQPNEKKE